MLCSPQPREALRDSPNISEVIALEEGSLAANSQDRCERSLEGGERSDFISDREDSPDALSEVEEDPYIGWESTGSGPFCTAHTKARRRQFESAKYGRREAAEIYTLQSSCNKSTCPQKQMGPNISLKLSTREVRSAEIHPQLRDPKDDLHQKTVFTYKSSTGTCRLKKKSQKTSVILDADELLDPHEVTVNVPPETSNTNQLNDFNHSERYPPDRYSLVGKFLVTQHHSLFKHKTWPLTRSTDIKSKKIKYNQKFKICNVEEKEIQTPELFSTYSVLKRCNSLNNDDKCCRHKARYKNRSRHSHSLHVVTDDIKCKKNYSNIQFIQETAASSVAISERLDTTTRCASQNLKSENRDTPHAQINVSVLDEDTSLAVGDESPVSGSSEVYNSVTNFQNKDQKLGVHFQEDQFEHNSAQGVNPLGTLNKTGSSITFTTVPLNTWATVALPGLSGHPDREEVSGRPSGQKLLQARISQSWLFSDQTQDIYANHLDQENDTLEKDGQFVSPNKPLARVKSSPLEAKPESIPFQSDNNKGPKEVLTQNFFSDNRLLFSDVLEAEDPSSRLSDSCRESACSPLQPETEPKTESSYICHDQKQIMDMKHSNNLLQSEFSSTTILGRSEVNVYRADMSNADACCTHLQPGETGTMSTPFVTSNSTEFQSSVQHTKIQTNPSRDHREQHQLQEVLPEVPYEIKSSLSHSDSNNNTKVVESLSDGAQSKCKAKDKNICILMDVSVGVTHDFMVDKVNHLEHSTVTPGDHRSKSEDSIPAVATFPKSQVHLSSLSSDQLQNQKTLERFEEGLKPFIPSSEMNIELTKEKHQLSYPVDYSLSRKLANLSKSKLDSEVSPGQQSEREKIQKQTTDGTVTSITSTSDCNGMKEPLFLSTRNTSIEKITKQTKSNCNLKENKCSMFSPFAKKPSLKEEEVRPKTLSEEGNKNVLSEQDLQKHHSEDNNDDEVSATGDTAKQAGDQALLPVRHRVDEKDGDLFPSCHCTHHVCELVSQGHNGDDKGSNSENHRRQIILPNEWSFKNSPNICMCFAELHKFEPPLAQENIDMDSGKARSKVKKNMEAEHLKRSFSVTEGEYSKVPSEDDLMFFPFLDRLTGPGLSSSLRTHCHTDYDSKKGVSYRTEIENQNKTCPESLPFTLCLSGPSSSSDNSSGEHLSHTNSGRPHSPFRSRSHTLACEGSAGCPLRPFSPKPNSPRPAAQRQVFRYRHTTKTSPVSAPLLSQSVSVEGLTLPPEKPKSLKPSTSPRILNFSPPNDVQSDFQSQVSLYDSGSIGELEVRKQLIIQEQIFLCSYI